MYYVYILKSEKDGSYYKGFTANLKSRVEKHNRREVIYSAKKAPYKLVWYCAFVNKDKAIEFEKYLKIGSGFAFAKKHFL